ncbi:unnamed protein product [Paramecium sonneborni]|uniref:Fatty acid desaturase domain-containing protein n=1 Tax=Paramecium sonneborni TaxID=65129 RepID=A0A8S1QR15_9CILI|nr:unnamed protein product [Paramecium sonneborni]
MSPQPEPNNNVVQTPENGEVFRFIYKNKEYDLTEYVPKHPAGKSFFEKMKDEKQDITEYFRCLHSKKALRILKSQKVIRNDLKESEDSKRYSHIKKQVKDLFQPDWTIEILLLIGLSLGLYLGVTSDWYIAIPTIALTQIVAGWQGHSTNHNRNPLLYKLSIPYGIIHGFSTDWWQFKHNNHHIFTNRIGKDDDINHQYQMWQYGFLYLKWKFDSIITSYNKIDILYVLLHQLIVFQQKIWIYFIAQYIAGFFSACILIGNHEREYKFFNKIDKPFIEHQIITSRNYDWTDWLSNLLMGGMQFQTEHHLFPQIPFYRLPYAAKIINRELNKFGYKIHIGKIL